MDDLSAMIRFSPRLRCSRDNRIAPALALALVIEAFICAPLVHSSDDFRNSHPFEFSGTVVKQVNGKKYQAQVFAKDDRLRLEYKYAIRTEYGYAAIEIIRLDKKEAWYLLAQRKELLITPLDPDDVLPMQPPLPGERGRTLLGEGTAAGRAAQQYEVHTDREGRIERWYEWVDAQAGVVLKLVSRDRDWSLAYERIRWSPQPSAYFEEPPGYRPTQSRPASGKRS